MKLIMLYTQYCITLALNHSMLLLYNALKIILTDAFYQSWHRYDLATMTLTQRGAEKLRIIQLVMKHVMFNVCLRNKIRNNVISKRTNVTDVLQRVKNLKWSKI